MGICAILVTKHKLTTATLKELEKDLEDPQVNYRKSKNQHKYYLDLHNVNQKTLNLITKFQPHKLRIPPSEYNSFQENANICDLFSWVEPFYPNTTK